MADNNDVEDGIALACIAVVSICGLFSNGLSLYITRTKSRFRNAFGILCSTFLICNLQAIFVLFTWCSVVLIVKSPILSSPELFPVRFIGVLVNGGWFASISVHFFLAINRFCAFVYATKYNRLWSESKAIVVGIVSWTFGTVLSMAHLYEECSILFNEASDYQFFYQQSFYGEFCSNADGIISAFIIVAMGCIDFTTLIKIISYRRKMRRSMMTSTGNAINERDVLFFKQSCVLSFLYITTIVIMLVHEGWFTNKWLMFLASTIMWVLSQTLDGVIFLTFNRSMIFKATTTRVKNLNRFQITTRY